MKRYLIAVFLLLVFASPAQAETYTWTNANGCQCWNVATNWDPNVAAGPTDGDTVQFLDGGIPLPTSQFLNGGETLVVVIDGAQNGTAFSIGYNITAFCGALNWNYSSLTIGASGRNVDSINLNKDSAASGTITAYGTILDDAVPTDIANATITVKSGGLLWAYTTNWAITQAITIEAGGTLNVEGVTLLANGGVNLAGTLDLSYPFGSPVLDVGTLPLTCTGNAIILWGEGDILGGLNAGGFAVTHTGATSANSITCDVAGILDLGTTTANAIAVTTSAAVTIGNSFACGTLSTGANITCATAKTLTVGAGGYTMTNGTISGTLSVNLSAAAGAYTQTAGTIAADAVLNVTMGTGAVTYTALTKTGTAIINITLAGTSNIGWSTPFTSPINTLTVNGAGTLTSTTYAQALAGSGSLALDANIFGLYQAVANDFWAFTGSVTGTGAVNIYAVASRSNTAPITIASTGLVSFLSTAASVTFTLTGKLTTAGAARVIGSTSTHTGTVVCNGGSSFGGAVTLGVSTSSGILTLGPNQVHTFASTIAVVGTGEANALNLGGRLILGGTLTGTGLAVTVAGDGVIDCAGKGKVTAVTATGRRLVVRRAVHSTTGIPLRGWQDDSCVNTRFLGRKEIGAPGVQ